MTAPAAAPAPVASPAPAADERVPTKYVLALLASFLFGFAITFSRGAYSEPALVTVLLAFELVVWLFVATLRGRKEEGTLTMAAAIGAIGVPLCMVYRAATDPQIVIYPIKQWDTGHQMILVTGGLMLTYVPFLVPSLRKWELDGVKWGRVALFAVAVFAAGYDVIKTSPRPYIDTWVVQQLADQELLAGHDPYETVAVRDTGPRAANDVPFVYPPTQIYLSLPGWIAAKDVRWGHLSCLLLAGLFLRLIVLRSKRNLPSVLIDAPMLFLWMQPKMFFIIEQSWVDPVQVMVICAATTAHVYQRPRLATVLFGVVLTAKQTMFWLAGLAGSIFGYKPKQWLIAGAVGGAAVLPFALWNFGAMKHALFDFVNALPARPDALTFINFLARHVGIEIPPNGAFLMALAVAGVSAWKLRGSLVKFGVAALATYTIFFVFNRWAFANYYFLLSGLAALTAALALHEGLEAPAPAVAEPKNETAPAVTAPAQSA
ncbi:MAG: hypothetical protein QM723_20505 [Myxococcaceae bacterium]